MPHFGARVRAYYLNQILEKLKPRIKVLDAGCGIGLNSFLAGRHNLIVTGVDNDPEKISSAKQILEKISAKNITFEKGTILNLHYDPKSFDSVICFEVLEHLKDDEKALREISRVLKNRGKLVLSVPGVGAISRINQHAKHHHREGYSRKDLENKLMVAGFKINQVIGIEHTPLGLGLRYINDAVHKRSLFVTTALFFIFYPLAILDGLLPQIITPQNWIIVAEKIKKGHEDMIES